MRYLQAAPAEVDALFGAFLIGVTSFFRDPEGRSRPRACPVCQDNRALDRRHLASFDLFTARAACCLLPPREGPRDRGTHPS